MTKFDVLFERTEVIFRCNVTEKWKNQKISHELTQNTDYQLLSGIKKRY